MLNDVAEYYRKLARWLEVRAESDERYAVAKDARHELDVFCAQNCPGMHKERERLLALGHKLTPIGRLQISPQDPARMRRGADYYRREAARIGSEKAAEKGA